MNELFQDIQQMLAQVASFEQRLAQLDGSPEATALPEQPPAPSMPPNPPLPGGMTPSVPLAAETNPPLPSFPPPANNPPATEPELQITPTWQPQPEGLQIQGYEPEILDIQFDSSVDAPPPPTSQQRAKQAWETKQAERRAAQTQRGQQKAAERLERMQSRGYTGRGPHLPEMPLEAHGTTRDGTGTADIAPPSHVPITPGAPQAVEGDLGAQDMARKVADFAEAATNAIVDIAQRLTECCRRLEQVTFDLEAQGEE